MKFMSQAAVAAAALCSASSPAWADDQLFAYSAPTGGITLTLNGTTVLNSTASGWYDSDGYHDAANSNYIVGTYNGKSYNDFFVFDLSAITETITSAVFSAPRFTSVYGSGEMLQLNLYNVTTPVSTLIASQSGAVGTAIFTDLGDARIYGSQTFDTNDYATAVAIAFKAGGLNRVNQARGSNFAFGGALNVGAIPEPATWAMMFLGFGLVGAAIRYRRRSTNTVYA